MQFDVCGRFSIAVTTGESSRRRCHALTLRARMKGSLEITNDPANPVVGLICKLNNDATFMFYIFPGFYLSRVKWFKELYNWSKATKTKPHAFVQR
jgi:hypothetical protein